MRPQEGYPLTFDEDLLSIINNNLTELKVYPVGATKISQKICSTQREQGVASIDRFCLDSATHHQLSLFSVPVQLSSAKCITIPINRINNMSPA